MHDQYFHNFAQHFQEQSNDSERRHMLDMLWEGVLDNGGVMLQSHETLFRARIPHLMFLMAAKDIDQRRLFVLADPEIRGFKMLSYADMTVFILEKDLEWDVMLG